MSANMNKIDKVCKWLTNEWDRVRIPINEVRDNLDYGRKSWEKIIESEGFINFMKENRIKIKSIPKMGKTLYFTVY